MPPYFFGGFARRTPCKPLAKAAFAALLRSSSERLVLAAETPGDVESEIDVVLAADTSQLAEGRPPQLVKLICIVWPSVFFSSAKPHVARRGS